MIELATTPRARRTDPSTSHEAAARSVAFSGSHKQQILAALREHGAGTAEWISEWTGLTVVQIDRRTKELFSDGQIVPALNFSTGLQMEHNGFSMWEAA